MRYIWTIWITLLAFSQVQGQNAAIGNKLQQWLANEPASNRTENIIITFSEQLAVADLLYAFERDFTPLDRRARHIISASMQLSAQTQASFLPQFEVLQQQAGVTLEVVSFYWIANAVEVSANAAAITALQQLPGLMELELSNAYQFMLEKPTAEEPSVESPNGKEPGLSVIGAPALWQMGYTGKARKALLIDTGVWPTHPAISGQFLGNRQPLSQTWLPYDFQTPADKSGNHGTHVIGTVLGLDSATNDTIGVAFGAYFIATDPVANSQTTSKPILDYIRAYQWSLNPDNDTTTTNDIPDVINNSWGRTNVGNDSLCTHPLMQQALLAVEAAGIANVFSAGNNGPSTSTTGFLASIAIDTLNVFSIGALDGNNTTFPIAGFSSRGPTTCLAPAGSSLAIKPEVSAPGVNVRSADGPTGYGSKSGTSMAAPHVSGAVLLLKEAFPQLSGRQVLNALYQTTTDLGNPGEDNTYGRGLINLPAAYSFLAATHTPAAPASKSYDLAIAGIDSPSIELFGSFNCDQLSPNVLDYMRAVVVNLGDSTVNNFKLVFRLNGSTDTIDVMQPLLAGQQTTVTFPLYNLHPATVGSSLLNDLHLELLPTLNEVDLLNNHWQLYFRSQNIYNVEIANETFDSTRTNSSVDLADWLIKNPDQDATTWIFTQIPAPNASNTAAAMLMRNYGPRNGQIDELISPAINIVMFPVVSSGSPTITFDMAYSNRTNFRDSLFIEFQASCERPFFQVYKTGGDSMRTFGGVNPTDSSQWRRVTATFSQDSLVPFGLARLKLKTKNDFGGNLYITNLGFYYMTGNVKDLSMPQLKVYPNPVSDILHLELESGRMLQLDLLDMQGKRLQSWPAAEANQMQIQLTGLPAGMYLLRLTTDKGNIHSRIIKP
ncbi:MAG: S8 family peptidase [Sphingobacteriaceae bacterium]|nr:S8 family peptidase [Sphingobacteriaceae bacterium]